LFEELGPAFFALDPNHIQAEYFTPPLLVDARRDHHGHLLDPLVLAYLLIHRVHPHVAHLGQGPFPELTHFLVQRSAEVADLGGRNAGNPHFRQDRLHLARAHALHHYAEFRTMSSKSRRMQRRPGITRVPERSSTQRYLGLQQDLVDAPCDRLGLKL